MNEKYSKYSFQFNQVFSKATPKHLFMQNVVHDEN